ncbi:MAG: hypothetical protein GY811_09070 [Myxococcales bacterium]|nr:hypothetical protein [Myxococcales bacterium]
MDHEAGNHHLQQDTGGEVYREYESACTFLAILCEMEDLSLCDVNEPKGGAFLRLFTSDAVLAAAACFDAACNDISEVNVCLDSVFDFNDGE